uniref:Uncharacterized protein n=1 Tax=Lactuca sativa TaxID=4236 RepID=A0A9R1WRH3_LACSA|nr:hypothetical protein LSAT_V11C100031090 [Lactuca sativa]
MNVTSDRKTLVVFDPPRKGTRTEAEIEGVQWWLRKSQGGAEGGTSVLVFGIIRSQEKQQSKEVTWWSELTAAAAVEVDTSLRTKCSYWKQDAERKEYGLGLFHLIKFIS